MKRYISVLLLLILLLSSVGCSRSPAEEIPVPSTESPATTSPLPDVATPKKVLVVYYSYSRNTAAVANRIAELLDSDLFEIKTVHPYPDDPHETADISIEERKTGNLPELENDLPDLSGYDVIFIGGPIWNGYTATPLAAYLEQTDLTGKTVIPFSTSMGSGQTGYMRDFESRAKNPERIGEYLDIQFPGNGQPDAFSPEELDERLTEWLREYTATPLYCGYVTLNSGYTMPILGLGTWTLTGEVCETAVYEALKDGYRLIDTAKYYGNQEEVGNAVRKAIADGIVTREEVFVTTKIVPSGDRDYGEMITQCNEALGLEYIDLMLIHQHGSGEKALYAAMEQAVHDGVIRSIGISNFYTQEEYDEVLEYAEIIPAVIQNENHIFHQNTELQHYVSEYGTFVESYYPFGGRGHTKESMNHETIQTIAAKYGKTGAQVILRWHLQAGYIAIPGSSNPDHIAENFDVFDFSLTKEEMNTIAQLDTGTRYESW